MEKLRLRINMSALNLQLPISYKTILQAAIYNMLSAEDQENFYHDYGYTLKDKKYKLFVFSDLFGAYKTENKKIIFEKNIDFYIDSLDSRFVLYIYNYLMNNEYIFLKHQPVHIDDIQVMDTPIFKDEKSLTIKTISPIVAYTSKDKHFTYYKPSDIEFCKLVKTNLSRKAKAYQYPLQEVTFDVEEVIFEKQRLVNFKNTFYISYLSEMRIHVNYDTFKLLYETGMAAKNSCGFGMIKIANHDKNILYL